MRTICSLILQACLVLFVAWTASASQVTNTLAAGQILPGSISGASPTNYYTFNATANEVVSFALVKTNGGASPYFLVYGPQGGLVTEHSGEPVAHLPILRLPQTGQYTVHVISASLTGSYDYLLSFSKATCDANVREPTDAPESMLAGQMVQGQITTSDMDTFCFDATANDVAHFALISTAGNAVPYFYVFDPSGDRVVEYGAAPVAHRPSVRLPETGRYTVVIISATLTGTYDYRLSVSTTTCGLNVREANDDPEPILPGQIARGQITPSDMDTFCFDATANEVASFALLKTNGSAVPYLYVVDPSGDLVSEYGADPVAHLAAVRLPETGRYSVIVLSATLTGSYDYLLSFSKTTCGINMRETTDDPEGLLPGQIARGQITPSDMDTFCFDATANEVANFALLKTNGAAVPYLYVFDPSGDLVTEHGADPVAHLPAVRLPETGRYSVVILSATLRGDYAYLLSFSKTSCGANLREAGDDPEPVLPGQIAYGQITPSDMDTFCFSATANEVASFALLRTNGSAVPYLYVFDPSGALVTEYGADPVAHLAAVRLPADGQYTVMVLSATLNGAFDYLLSFSKTTCGVNQREAGDDPEAILPGQIAHGQITPSDMDTYCFDATANEVASFALLKTNGTAVPYLYVFGPSGNAITEYGTDPVVHFPAVRLPETGRYTVLVISASLNGSYDYLLSFSKATCGANVRESGDDPESLIPGRVSYGRITPSDMDSYCFTAAAGDALYIGAGKTNGAAVPYMYLFSPSGEIMNETPGHGAIHLYNVRAPETGQYTVLLISATLREFYDYTVCAIKNPGPNLPEDGDGLELLDPGETRSAQITVGDVDAYTFYAIAGDTVTTVAERPFGTGSFLVSEVYAPSGAMLRGNLVPYNATFRLSCLPETGLYQVLVRDDDLTDPFPYTLSVSRSPLLPPSSGAIQYLAALRCSTNVVLRWESNSTGFILESSPTIDTPIWSPVLAAPYTIANHFYLDVDPLDVPIQFYRLRCTNCPAP